MFLVIPYNHRSFIITALVTFTIIYCDMRADTRRVEQENAVVAWQRHGKHLSVATTAHVTIVINPEGL